MQGYVKRRFTEGEINSLTETMTKVLDFYETPKNKQFKITKNKFMYFFSTEDVVFDCPKDIEEYFKPLIYTTTHYATTLSWRGEMLMDLVSLVKVSDYVYLGSDLARFTFWYFSENN